jgi:predicted transcriptional regulator
MERIISEYLKYLEGETEWIVFTFLVVIGGSLLSIGVDFAFVLLYFILTFIGFIFVVLLNKKRKHERIEIDDFEALFYTGSSVAFRILNAFNNSNMDNYTTLDEKTGLGRNIIAIYHRILANRNFFVNKEDIDFTLSQKGKYVLEIINKIKNNDVLNKIKNDQKVDYNILRLCMKYGFVEKIKLDSKTKYQLTKLGSRASEHQ